MSNNIFRSLNDFLIQYTGEWNPSEDHWLGLDFEWQGQVYRFQTDSMYNAQNTILEDGREARFGVYKKRGALQPRVHDYELIGEFATVEEALTQCVIDGVLLSDIITSSDTELLGQD